MNRILMAATAVLVASAPLAFAASDTNVSPSEMTTMHCSSLDQRFSQMKFQSDAARQNAQEEAMSLCREDRHKNGGKQADHEAHDAARRG